MATWASWRDPVLLLEVILRAVFGRWFYRRPRDVRVWADSGAWTLSFHTDAKWLSAARSACNAWLRQASPFPVVIDGVPALSQLQVEQHHPTATYVTTTAGVACFMQVNKPVSAGEVITMADVVTRPPRPRRRVIGHMVMSTERVPWYRLRGLPSPIAQHTNGGRNE